LIQLPPDRRRVIDNFQMRLLASCPGRVDAVALADDAKFSRIAFTIPSTS
jgi:hypothetical protein